MVQNFLGLSPQDQQDLLNFLRSLSGASEWSLGLRSRTVIPVFLHLAAHCRIREPAPAGSLIVFQVTYLG